MTCRKRKIYKMDIIGKEGWWRERNERW